MNKKKAKVCTTLFAVVVSALFISSMFIKNKYGTSLFYVISPCICGLWFSGCTEKFYNWLLKE